MKGNYRQYDPYVQHSPYVSETRYAVRFSRLLVLHRIIVWGTLRP
jgi:hypothetical protein